MKYSILLLLLTPLLSACAIANQLYECNANKAPGYSIKDCMVSPNRLQRDQLPAALTPLLQTCETFGTPRKTKLEIIGHQAGSYRYYPMGLNSSKDDIHGNNWSSRCTATAKDVTALMDQTFEPAKKIDAIEIDVHAADLDKALCEKGNDCIFVMHNNHNTKEWQILAENKKAYLNENSLKNVLIHFSKAGYIKNNKHLYVELKSTRGCNAPNQSMGGKCTNLGERVAALLNNMVAKNELDLSDHWLSFTSFSASALEALHHHLNTGIQDSIGYALIAGMHPLRPIEWGLAQAKGSVPLFTEDLQQFAEQTVWLDSIWFSVQGIPKFGKLFQEISDKRKAYTKDKPLKFTVATYSLKYDRFNLMMIAQTLSFQQELSAIMIDIDDAYSCP
ncbi:hypothetical protein D8Y20_07420 [Mariprofundus sp. EBB-1]|nr:hypothetical protein D8Y20_07420 [Mariprofundus sp. EBB-1]